MNYRTITTYIFLVGFFVFLGFAYFNYSKTSNGNIANVNVSTEKVEEVVKKVISDNPELIIKSLENYQMQKMQEAMAESEKKVKENLSQIEDSSNDPRVGAKEAKVKVVEFFDYNCGYCKRMANIKSKILEENPDIQYVFKEFPILGEPSVLAAKYALAVNIVDSSKYLPFHLALLNDNGVKNEETLLNIAGKVGVNIESLKKALSDNKINETIQANQSLARAINIGGTPTFIVAGELVRGADYQLLSNTIKQAKAKVSGSDNANKPIKAQGEAK